MMFENRSRQLDVRDIDSVEDPSSFDLVVAASGYEPRCTHVVRTLAKNDRHQIGKRLFLLEFDDTQKLQSRIEADKFFDECDPFKRMKVTKNHGLAVVRAISEYLNPDQKARILVDYTAMSRLLYLTLIDLAKTHSSLEIVFAYSVGEYGEAARNYPISRVGQIRPVPGLEGLPHAGRQRLYVFGLGYDGLGTRALIERLEAQRFAVFWADPGAAENSASIAKERNRSAIDSAVFRFSCPLRTVASAVRVLSRLCFETTIEDRVVFVPVGPKPHILACGLAAAQFTHTAVLAPYLASGGIREQFPLVQAQGEIIYTSIRTLPTRLSANREPMIRTESRSS